LCCSCPFPVTTSGTHHSKHRSARGQLVCYNAGIRRLAREVGLSGHDDGATEPEERARLRAELDGLIAHLYGLSEEEFTHVLAGFPLVQESGQGCGAECVPRCRKRAIKVRVRIRGYSRLALSSVRLRNFKAVQDSGTIQLTPLTVFIGNNGSGKSSLIEGLETLRNIVAHGLDAAMETWHGFEHIWNQAVQHKPRRPREGRTWLSNQCPLKYVGAPFTIYVILRVSIPCQN